MAYEIFAAYLIYDDEDVRYGSIAKLFKDPRSTRFRASEVDTNWVGSLLLRNIAHVKRLNQETART